MKFLLIPVFFLLLSACQKQNLELAEVEPPKDAVEYTQELKLNDKLDK